MADRRQLARRLLPLLELASPSAGDGAVERVCTAARTRFGPIAAVGVPPASVAVARAVLRHSTIAVGALTTDAEEIASAVAAGAEEVEFALPHDAVVAGDVAAAAALALSRDACRVAPGRRALFKVTLEVGMLGDWSTVRRAARVAIDAGADMLVTASGGREPGTSLAAAEAVLAEIAAARTRRRWVGVKLAGGLHSLAAVEPYVAAVERRLGSDAVSAAGLRLDGQPLLDEILAALAP